MSNIVFISGLDLGQSSDPSALVIVERTEIARGQATYAVRHIQRWQLGTPYTQMARDTASLMARKPLPQSTLVIDATGVGAGVVDHIFELGMEVELRPITITAGHNVTEGSRPGWKNVPKKDLVATLQVLLQSGRLKIPRSLPLADLLAKELANFRVKITASANEVFGAWRDGQHDDIVLACALGTWVGENGCVGDMGLGLSERTPLGKAPPGVFAKGKDGEENTGGVSAGGKWWS